MRAGWEAEQVSKCRTPGGAGARRAREEKARVVLARAWKEGVVWWVREKGRTRRKQEWLGGREESGSKRWSVSLIQHVDYILRDASFLGYLRITTTEFAAV